MGATCSFASTISIIPSNASSSIPGMYFANSASYSLVFISLFIFCTFSIAFIKLDPVLSMEEDFPVVSKGGTVFPS